MTVIRKFLAERSNHMVMDWVQQYIIACPGLHLNQTVFFYSESGLGISFEPESLKDMLHSFCIFCAMNKYLCSFRLRVNERFKYSGSMAVVSILWNKGKQKNVFNRVPVRGV